MAVDILKRQCNNGSVGQVADPGFNMAGFFHNLGQFVGKQARKAHWMVQSLTGDQKQISEAEHLVGRDLAASFLEDLQTDPDPAVATWLNEITTLIGRQIQDPYTIYTARSILVEEPNAFALPGGFIFVTRSLLKLCAGSHDKLAFVLGHEMAHIHCGHARQRMMTKAVMGTATRFTPVSKLLKLPVGSVLSTLMQQGYSREHEMEADANAVQWMTRAGFNGRAVVEVMEQLQALRSGTESPAGYLSSHPGWDVRIAAITTMLP